jgi:hypothetical protein
MTFNLDQVNKLTGSGQVAQAAARIITRARSLVRQVRPRGDLDIENKEKVVVKQILLYLFGPCLKDGISRPRGISQV